MQFVINQDKFHQISLCIILNSAPEKCQPWLLVFPSYLMSGDMSESLYQDVSNDENPLEII